MARTPGASDAPAGPGPDADPAASSPADGSGDAPARASAHAPVDALDDPFADAPADAPATLVLADLHADPAALAAVWGAVTDPAFARRLGPIERVVNLGDVVGRGRAPRPLVRALAALEDKVETVWLRGNHDEHLLATGRLLAGGDLAARAHEELLADAELVARLADRPDRVVLDGGPGRGDGATATADGGGPGSVLCVHGGPVDPARLGGGATARRTWQRLGDRALPAADGHRVTPAMALDALEEAVGPGGLLLCGHEHAELLLERPGGSADGIRPPAVRRVAVDTAAGRVEGRVALRRPGTALLARLGLGARHAGRARFGYLRGDRVHLLAVQAEGTGRR